MSAEKRARRFIARTGEREEFNQYWYSPASIDALVREIEEHTRNDATPPPTVETPQTPDAVTPKTSTTAGSALHDDVGDDDGDAGGVATRVCFLSTPSLFCAFDRPDDDSLVSSRLFDFDESLRKRCRKPSQFVRWDFNKPDAIDKRFHHQFHFVVSDPPFITEDAWRKYARAIELLLVKPCAAPAPAPSGETTAEFPGVVSSTIGKVLLTTIPENADLLRSLLGVRPCRWRPRVPNLVYQYSLFVNYDSALQEQANPEVD